MVGMVTFYIRCRETLFRRLYRAPRRIFPSGILELPDIFSARVRKFDVGE
jgi:hypothetical protein